MANILEDAISSAFDSVAQQPSRAIQEINASVGTRTKILQGTGAIGGAIGSFAGAVSEPRKKYNFGISINVPGSIGHGIEANVKSITRPKIHMDYRHIRYYNTIRRQLNAIHFDPITIVIYDDLASHVQQDFQALISSKLTSSSNELLGGSINIADFDRSVIEEVVIHSSASPVTSLIAGGFDAIGQSLQGQGISSLQGALSNAGVRHMKLKYCTIEAIDFGEFDFSNSEANLITLTLSFQSLIFGSSTVGEKALEVIGGIGARILTNGL